MPSPLLLSTAKSPHSIANKLGRVAWSVVWLILFRPSPRLCWGWRRFLMRMFGAKVGHRAAVDNTVRIWAPWNLTLGDHSAIGHHVDLYCLAPVVVGSNSIVSQYSFLCTGSHDYNQPHFPVTSKPVTIGEGTWIAADVFVGPGVTIGDGTVVGARSSVFRDIPANTIAAGNPARVIKPRSA